MTISLKNVQPWIFVGPFLLALAACPPKDNPGTTDDPEATDTGADASTSTTTAVPTSSGEPDASTGETTAPEPGTSTGETTAPSEPDTTTTSATTLDPDTTSTTSATTLDPDTTSTTEEPDTTGGDACALDLTASLAVSFDKCESQLVLVATVHNVGISVDADAGIDVTFYEGTDVTGLKLGTKPTVELLPPGGSTELTWTVDAPPPGVSRDYHIVVGPVVGECNEDNNSATITDAKCPD